MFLAAVANGFSSWLPAAIGRTWALTPPEIGRVLGPLGLLTGPITLLGFGYLMDRFGKSSPGAAMRVAFFGTGLHLPPSQIGRASCRERVCQYVLISVVAVSFTQQKRSTNALIIP